jgi:2,3-diketo-5-methylthio-1-phosphopentane phosphatase
MPGGVMGGEIRILCDFDGTIARVDTVDLLLERLADPSWKLLEEQWVRGEIGSRECMTEQIALLRGGWRAVERVLGEVEIAPTFAPFAAWCRSRGVPLFVASDGLDRVISHLLARDGIQVDAVCASQLVEGPRKSLSLRFPQMALPTSCGAEVCKCCFFPPTAPGEQRILIGDGRSDFCAAGQADLVFAFSSLALHCRQNDIPFIPFSDFDGVRELLSQHLDSRHARTGSPLLLREAVNRI